MKRWRTERFTKRNRIARSRSIFISAVATCKCNSTLFFGSLLCSTIPIQYYMSSVRCAFEANAKKKRFFIILLSFYPSPLLLLLFLLWLVTNTSYMDLCALMFTCWRRRGICPHFCIDMLISLQLLLLISLLPILWLFHYDGLKKLCILYIDIFVGWPNMALMRQLLIEIKLFLCECAICSMNLAQLSSFFSS